MISDVNDKKSEQGKEHQAPAAAKTELTWTAPDGTAVRIDVMSEWILLRKKEKPAAEIFHTYYRLADASAPRSITFVFNGGPGAASAYLHVGGLGPQRVAFDAKGQVPPPPVRLINNTESWIAFTDLVFVDPVATGFSRVIEPESKASDKDKATDDKAVDEKEFFGLNRDLESLGEFIERFLSKHKLWNVPVVIAGESYGGFRTAKLARRLQEKHGVGLSAAIAISPALEWALLNESDYDVLRSMDTFCVMALAASFHKRSRVFTNEPIETQRAAIEAFATGDLAQALLGSVAQDAAARQRVFIRAAEFLGLPDDLVIRAQGRVPFWRFAREVLRDEQKVVGIYDATVTGIDPFPDRETQEGPDPTFANIERMFASGINHLLRSVIGVDSERRYELLSMDVNRAWKVDGERHAFDAPAGGTDDLRFAMSMNPDMKVIIVHGYYDMVTPYFSSERLVAQMKLLPEQRANLFIRHFAGGHMFYTWDESRKAFRDWAKGFYG